MDKILELKKVNFSFNKNEVLKDISFNLYKGDFLGLIGPNGSGKTTLIKLILNVYNLKSGKIKLLGKDINKFNHWDKIGYVQQKASNIEQEFPANVYEIVSMGLLSKKKFPKIIYKNDSKKIIEALKSVNMDQLIHKRINELSGGQQQRIMIARALISNPEILILDEPTTGIDPEMQNNFYEILGKLNKKGITIILISHDIGTITKHVNKIAYLNKNLEFYGTHKEFCAKDIDHKHEKHIICIGK
jgi:zinc transport system ATP-binding protein